MFHAEGVTLFQDLTFLPKVISAFRLSASIHLPTFSPNPQSQEDRYLHSLDVRRAPLRYLNRTTESRKDPNLFISYA